MRLLKSQFTTAVTEATASLTETPCSLNFSTVDEIRNTYVNELTKHGDHKKALKAVDGLRLFLWTPHIGRTNDNRISKDVNPICGTDAFVIQDSLPAADILEIQERIKGFKIKPTFVGLGIIDKLPQYIFQLKTLTEIEYGPFFKITKTLALANGIEATRASHSPSSFWLHTGNYVATGSEPIDLPATTVSDGPSHEEIEAKAEALAKNMWHEATTNSYWFADTTGVIRKRQEQHAKAEFVSLGLSGTARKNLSRADHYLRLVRLNNSVDGVVEAPFRPVGPFTYGGKIILNRSQVHAQAPSPAPALTRPDPATNPRSTPWERFCAYTHALFGPDQLPFVDALMCRAYLSVKENRETFKQAVIFSGPANAGKTLWVSQVVIPLLGGRSGNLKNYLLGKGAFTESLFSSPVGLLDDQTHDEKDKTRFTSALKNLISSKHQEFHAKFMPEHGIPWQGAVWILCNLDAESFASTLPNLGMSILDKLHLLKAQTPEDFDFTSIPHDIQAALPLYARYLIENETSIMAAVTPHGPAVKYGIQPYHSRDLLNSSRMTEDATTVLEIIEILQKNYFSVLGSFVKITATEFINALEKIEELQPTAKRLTSKKVGEALSNLSKIHDWIKVNVRKGNCSNRYTIDPVSSDPAPAPSAQRVTIPTLPPSPAARSFYTPTAPVALPPEQPQPAKAQEPPPTEPSRAHPFIRPAQPALRIPDPQPLSPDLHEVPPDDDEEPF